MTVHKFWDTCWREVCPECSEDVIEWERTCFGLDIGVVYRCTNWKCLWEGSELTVLEVICEDVE